MALKKEIHGSEEELEKIMEKAAYCYTQVTVSEVFHCITHFMSELPGTGLFKKMVECCGGDQHEAENLIMSIYGSIIATITVNLAEEETGGKA